MPEELADFEECFLTGTAAEVTPVSEIGPYSFTVGEIASNLMNDYTQAVQPVKQRRGIKRALEGGGKARPPVPETASER